MFVLHLPRTGANRTKRVIAKDRLGLRIALLLRTHVPWLIAHEPYLTELVIVSNIPLLKS